MSTEPVKGEEGVQSPTHTHRWEVGDTPCPWTRNYNNHQVTTSIAQYEQMTQGSREGKVATAIPTCGSQLITSSSTSSSTQEKLAEEGREQCGIECTAGRKDDNEVCGGGGPTSQRGIDHIGVQDGVGTDSSCGRPGRCSVFGDVPRHRQSKSCMESVPCSTTTMSLPANSSTVDTQKSSESSDMSQSGSNSASLTDEDFPETDVSAEKDGSDIEKPGNGHAGETADVIEEAHLSDTAQDSDAASEHGSGTTHSQEHDADVADNQHPLSGPHRRHQMARQERRQGTTNPLRRLNLPPAMLAQWRAVGRQWGVEDDDDDIARVLMRHYEDMKAGRPPRPPPHQLCPDCGEVLQPVPCQECGPHKHSFRLTHDCGGGHSSGGKGGSFCP